MVHQSLQIQNSTRSLMDAQQMFVNRANSSQGKGPTKLMGWSPKAEADRYFSVNTDCVYSRKRHLGSVRQVGCIEGNDPELAFQLDMSIWTTDAQTPSVCIYINWQGSDKPALVTSTHFWSLSRDRTAPPHSQVPQGQ